MKSKYIRVVLDTLVELREESDGLPDDVALNVFGALERAAQAAADGVSVGNGTCSVSLVSSRTVAKRHAAAVARRKASR